jgi:hypothetical protein
MSRNSSWKVLALVVALVAGATTLPCGTAAAQELPFKASLTGNAHLSPTGDPAVLRNDETGQGNATHLGLFTWEDVEYADFDEIPGGVSVVATFTMTAANGDQLRGAFTSTGLFDVDGNLVIHGQYQFTGGTGRFANATGSGNIDAIAFLSPGLPFEGSFDGTIDY